MAKYGRNKVRRIQISLTFYKMEYHCNTEATISVFPLDELLCGAQCIFENLTGFPFDGFGP